jgi:hypothetical protein
MDIADPNEITLQDLNFILDERAAFTLQNER